MLVCRDDVLSEAWGLVLLACRLCNFPDFIQIPQSAHRHQTMLMVKSSMTM